MLFGKEHSEVNVYKLLDYLYDKIKGYPAKFEKKFELEPAMFTAVIQKVVDEQMPAIKTQVSNCSLICAALRDLEPDENRKKIIRSAKTGCFSLPAFHSVRPNPFGSPKGSPTGTPKGLHMDFKGHF